MKNFLSRFALLALVAGLAGCSALESDKIDYKSAGKAPSLDVPPDLTQLSRDSRYVVPGSTVSANASSRGGLQMCVRLPVRPNVVVGKGRT